MTTITFIGAGSVEFTRDLVADILSFPELSEANLRLHDVNEERLEMASGVATSIARQLNANPRITSHLDRREALQGSDFVINTVQIGGHAGIEIDIRVPQNFGVRQTVADTLGVGGIFRGLRTFPFLKELADDIMDVSPQAILLNYTNPMAMNVSFLAQVAPSLTTYGLCHSVFWTVSDLATLLGVPLQEVEWRSAGVNHQAWILSLEHQGKSLYPQLDELIANDPELRRRVRVDMYRRLGYYPTETSEHSSEYVPWYLPYPDEIDRLRIPVGKKLVASQEGLASFALTQQLLRDGADIPIESGATEYAPQVIHSMVTGTSRTIQVNVPNTGLITNLPNFAPVEVTATIDSNGIHPWFMGDLPVHCAALNRAYLNVVELVVRAAVQEDPRSIRHALMVDPNTAASISAATAWDLSNAMVEAHGASLPQWARQILEPAPSALR